jgi:glycosyltransferase involved in cell wall biosynthesis
LGKTFSVAGGLGKWLGYVDKFLLFPIKLRSVKNQFDVVHICDHSNAMYAKHLVENPHVVTCHDVLAIKSALGEVPQNEVSATGRKFQELILAGLKVAQLIVCVSEATRADMLRVTRRPPCTSTVVYLSLNYPYSPMERGEALARLDKLGFDGRTPFFIHVGGTVWYKNKLGVLEIYNSLRMLLAHAQPHLLMVGKPLSDPLLEYITANGLDSMIQRLSDVSNEDLRAAYSLAKGLIFPSLQEGFGWPVLEAQACGCPVFTSGRPPMNEVGGAAAVYFDPADAKMAAQIVAATLDESDVMQQRGLMNVLKFNVEKMIQGYISAYERVASAKKVVVNGARRHV